MRCKVCGSEYREGSLFCGTCGVSLKEENESQNISAPDGVDMEIPGGRPRMTSKERIPSERSAAQRRPVERRTAERGAAQRRPVASEGTGKKKRYGIIGIVAAVLVVALVAVFLTKGMGGLSYNQVVDKMFTSMFKGDMKAFMKLIPQKMIDYELEQEGISKDEMNAQLDQMSEMMKNQMSYIDEKMGNNWKITHEILSEKDVTGEDLENLRETYSEANVKISAAKKLEVAVSIKGDKNQDSDTMEIEVIKVGNSWYLDIDTFDDIF